MARCFDAASTEGSPFHSRANLTLGDGDDAMHVFDYIAMSTAVAFAVSLFAAFVFGGLPLP
jgi:hypothetical protein